MSADRLIYMPLGGAGEIGMNAYVYGFGPAGRERLILVDLGVAFPDMDGTPGVDLIYPDIGWLAERRDRLEAVFITHAHEDHLGAVGICHDTLRAPIHARKFTADIVRRKLSDRGHADRDAFTAQPWPSTVEAGPFRVGFAPISHSIPESSALVIDTPLGRIVHSGDFKIDREPVVGDVFDEAALGALAEPGVAALMCDSTNVLSPHAGRSESSIASSIESLIACCGGMFVATTFASNVARVKTLADAGARAGRSICLLGRAMTQMVEAARASGVLTEFPATISPDEAAGLAGEAVMLIVTGSQGEPRAASAQLSRGPFRGLCLGPGDMFLFSSKTIPGNETGVLHVINRLSEMGVDIVDDSSGLHHVSGHANRPDLELLHKLIKPRIVVPLHGEHRHLREHVKLCNSNGLDAVLAPNGTMVDLGADSPGPVEHVETGRCYLDGTVRIGAADGIVRERRRMAIGGHVLVSVLLEEDGSQIGEPWCEISGIAEELPDGSDLAEFLQERLAGFMKRTGRKALANMDDDDLKGGIRKTVVDAASSAMGKRPVTTVIISRLSD